MSDSFLSLYGREQEAQSDEGPLPTLASRGEIFRALDTIRHRDLVILGGGLSGVTIARAAALQGSDVLLVEPGYFGEHSTSWRDPIAGALTSRPSVVVRTLREFISVTSVVAPHLVTPMVWHDDIPHGALCRLALRIAQRAWRSHGVDRSQSIIPDIDERLLVRETALAARQEGAFVLSAATAPYVERDFDEGGYRVGVRDLLTGETIEIRTETIFIDPMFSHPVASRIGTPLTRRPIPHIPGVSFVFTVTRQGDAAGSMPCYQTIRLSDGSRGSVCEYVPGLVEVLVEGESRELPSLAQRAREACGVCGYVVLEEVSHHACGRVFDTRARVSHRDGVLMSKERVPWDIFSLSSRLLSQVPSCGTARPIRRPLPGEWRDDERQHFWSAARAAGVSESTIERVVRRWQGRVRYIPRIEDGFREVCPGVLNGEISLAVESDQVSSLEDLLFGSLELQRSPGWRECVPALTEALAGRTGLNN